jgi:DNA polymerase III subunit beta
MNLTIPRNDLLRLASRMAGVAERKSTMPILSNVLMQTNGSSVAFAATDLYLALNGTAAAEVSKAGTIAVNAKDVVDRVKHLADGPVTLTEKEGSLLIKGPGARRFTLRGMPGADFPPIPKPSDAAVKLTIDAGVLSSLINLTIFSVSTDETRAHLNAALLQWEGSTVRMVSTDGHRLSKAERVVDGKAAASEILIPLKALHEVKRIADEVYALPDDKRQPIDLTLSGAHVFLSGNGLTFGVKLVDAQFPPWKQVVPASWTHNARAPRAALLDAVKAMAIAADDKTGGIRLSLTNGALRLSSASADGGDADDEVPSEYSGPNLRIGFAARYVMDVLGALTCDEITIGLSGELDPIIFKPVTGPLDPAGDYLNIVMPMRI